MYVRSTLLFYANCFHHFLCGCLASTGNEKGSLRYIVIKQPKNVYAYGYLIEV